MGYDTNSPWNAYPIVISDAYDRGTLYVLVAPDNFADLYRMPAPVLNAIRSQLMGSFPIRLADAPRAISSDFAAPLMLPVLAISVRCQ
jgi:hypothetical protein